MKTSQDDFEAVVKEPREIRKDPKKWEKFMATQAEKALDNWRCRKKKK